MTCSRGPPLDAREDLAVELLAQLGVAAQDQAAARAAQGLVGGAGHHLGHRHRVGVQPGRHQAGDVGHVHHQGRPDLPGDLGELVELERAGVGAGAHHQELRLVLARQPGHLGHVEPLVGLVQAVGDDLEELPGEVDR
jgi:hypothetical protein